ncbi:MAG: hypothetical protein HFJ10_12470 [Lachnospiraceae bacterium]|nr:hypothetical protein [Lachnospiraceae bacterium]
MRERFLDWGKYIVLWFSVLLMGFLSIVSLISTTYFNAENSLAERPSYRADNLFLNLLILCIILFVLYWIHQKFDLEKIPTKILAAVTVIFVIGISIIWVLVSHTYPEADQKAVSYVAYLMSADDFMFFKHGKYMQVYPNQLGLSAIMECLYRITGEENRRAFMYVTALSNGAVAYLLYKITDFLFHKKRITHLVLFLSMGCIQVFLYTTFLYGITLGLALSLASVYCLLLFLERDRFLYGILSGIFIGASVLVKNNYSIFLVAMVLLLFFKALEKKKIRPVLAALILILSASLMGKALTSFYEIRSGYEITSGMPKSLWIAMGMQEGERAEGWYNAFNYDTFLNTDCDIEKSDAIAKESIKNSLQKFRENPAYAIHFYYKKIVSQWNEPTYASLWANQFHEGNFSKIVQSIYDGLLYVVLHEYMNFYQSLIFIATFVCLYLRRKEWKIEQLILMIVILGGFCFHIIWEAKSQYIFPYFVILLPYGAVGLSDLLPQFARLFQKVKNRK